MTPKITPETQYNDFRKRLQACANSPLKEESLCDANHILTEMLEVSNGLSIDQIRNLMELYYLIKAHSINLFRIKKT